MSQVPTAGVWCQQTHPTEESEQSSVQSAGGMLFARSTFSAILQQCTRTRCVHRSLFTVHSSQVTASGQEHGREHDDREHESALGGGHGAQRSGRRRLPASTQRTPAAVNYVLELYVDIQEEGRKEDRKSGHQQFGVPEHRVAAHGGQRGVPAPDGHREVERGDYADDAERVPHFQQTVASTLQ